MRGFTWIVDGQVAAMPRPWPEHVAALPSVGVGGVISLTEDVPVAYLRSIRPAAAHFPYR